MQLNANAILFDLDGVLANSIAVVEKSWLIWSRLHGMDFEEVMRVSHARRKSEIFAIIAPQLNAAEEIARLIKIENDCIDEVTPIPGALEFVNSLPHGSWAIGTSGEREVAVPRLRKLGMPVPEILIAAEDVEFGKPNPMVYLRAAAGIHADPTKCIVFEDVPRGIDAAIAAGATPVALLTTYPAGELNLAVARIPDFRGVRAVLSEGKLQGLTLDTGTTI